MPSGEQSSKLILWQLHEKLPKNSALTILWSFSIWGKLERWKSSISGCLMGWPCIKKIVLKSHLILCNNNKSFLDWIVICDEKWILHNNQQWPAQWLDQEEAPKHFPKPNLHQKKIMVTIWWSATRLIHYSFLNPGKTISSEKYAQQTNEMHRKLNTYSWHWSTERTQFFSHLAQPMLHKLKELGYKVLPYLAYSSNLSLTDYHFFKHLNNFLQGKCFHNQQDSENTF